MTTSPLVPNASPTCSGAQQEGRALDCILVAVACGPESETTATYAAILARQTGAHVVLLTVFPTGYSSGPDIVFTQLEERATCIHSAAVALEELREKVMPDLKVETLLREGSPATEILKVAEGCKADMIVIGTPEHGLLDRLFFGNEMHAMMQRAQVPVLTVPHHVRDDSTRGPVSPLQGAHS
ncbi:hypothetical protein BH10PLA1_BH10PLA1_21190 [soil metagenome]